MATTLYLNKSFELVSFKTNSSNHSIIPNQKPTYKIYCNADNITFSLASSNQEICKTSKKNYSKNILNNFETFKKSFNEGSISNLPQFIASAMIAFEKRIMS